MHELNTEDATKATTNDEADSKPVTSRCVTAGLVDRPGIEDGDALIAADMTRLSMDERDQVLHDIHGVPNVMEETPEKLHASLIKLQTELDKIHYKAAYELARSHNPAFVEDRVFRLKFLRADLLNASNAALRLVRHFELKLQLFGPKKLVKEITQDDLEAGDMKNLYSGYVQTLPMRDRAGRCVCVWLPPPIAHDTNVDDGQQQINKVSGGHVHSYTICFCSLF
jgi:hypothetical protein